MSNEGKFNWDSNTVPKFSSPQCGACDHNFYDDVAERCKCSVYGERPVEYIQNDIECPNKFIK